MKSLPTGLAGILWLTLALVGGCPPEDFDTALPVTAEEIDPIVTDDGLTAQEKRTQLEALGLSPTTINGLLQDEEFGNQFGGDLRTAYTKVKGDRFQSLTPDEVQIYAAEASEVDAELDVSINDVDAQSIVDFFVGAGIDSSAELGAFLDDNNSVVPDTIPDGVLEPVFVDFDADLLLPRLP